MTDNDTKKALECCVSVGNNCPKCPYFTLRFKGVHCKLRMLQDALALINRQEEKVEDLQRIVGLMSKRKYYRKFVDEVFRKQKGKELSDPDFDYIYQLFFEQKAEIERLQKHGEWIEKGIVLPYYDDDVDIVYECSICNSINIGESPYCPECGAKMKG